MKKYKVIVDYVMTATIVVEANDEDDAALKAGRFVHSPEGFDEYVRFAAPRNVVFGETYCLGGDGFEIPCEPSEFDGVMRDGYIEI